MPDLDADDCKDPVESSPGTGLDSSVVDEDEDPQNTPEVQVDKICG